MFFTCLSLVQALYYKPDELSFFFLVQQVVKIPKVNRHIMDSIMEDEIDLDTENVDKSSIKKKKRKLELNKAILHDKRFEEMFVNKVWNFTGCFSVLLLDCSLADGFVPSMLVVVYKKKLQHISINLS